MHRPSGTPVKIRRVYVYAWSVSGMHMAIGIGSVEPANGCTFRSRYA